MGNKKEENFNSKIGILEWFHFNDYEHLEKAITRLKDLGIKEIRTGISWAEWNMEGGKEWITSMINILSSEFNILPCFVYTPPKIAINPKTNSPPKEVKEYSKFIEEILILFGEKFEYIELWNEPNNIVEWDYILDKEWKLFSEMIKYASSTLKKYNKKIVLGGMAHPDPYFLEIMFKNNTLENIDIIGIHGFPNTWDSKWTSWEEKLNDIKRVMERNNSKIKLWITETGFSTLGNRDMEQIKYFTEIMKLNIEKIYWYSLYDLNPKYSSTTKIITGTYEAHEHHMGMIKSDETPKPLYEVFKLANTKSPIITSF